MGGGAAAAAAAGGWYFFLRSSTPGGPEGVLHDYASAFESEDAEAMDNLVHQDSPARGGFSDPVSQVESMGDQDISVSVESTEVLSREEAPNQPNVEEFATIEGTFKSSMEGESSTDTQTLIVAKTPEGEWKFWQWGG